ncbi:MAG TPA: NADH-quinone oxidoreductase subunit NuoN [Caulobacteraceae bacterium]|jgi:NADH-quinone oxidoreductase subunit N
MDYATLSVCAPELIVSLGALLVIFLGALGGPKATGALSLVSGVILIGAAYAAAMSPMGSAFHGAFVMDATARFSKVAIYVAAAFAIVLGYGWLRRSGQPKFEYPVLILLATLGMSMMVSAADLISLYVSIELQSLALYVLAAFQRDDAKSSEAGLKYFVLGALSSGLLLYGASLIYGFAGSMRFTDIAAATHGGAHIGELFGLIFLICGIAFKVSAAPFHMWTPDVYEGAPTPVVAFVAAAPKLAAMVLFARTLDQAFPGAIEQWRGVILILAVISFVVGAFGGLVQKDFKRLLAYSSIANIGYALLGIAAGTSVGIQAMLVFMVLYMIDVTGFFACLEALKRDGKPIVLISELAGLKRERPGIALALTALSLSVLGMPPFSGFWGKYFVFKSALAVDGLWPYAIAGLVASVVAAFYYLRVIKLMWFDPAPGKVDRSPAEARWIAYACSLFAGVLVWGALVWLTPAAEAASKSLGLH